MLFFCFMSYLVVDYTVDSSFGFIVSEICHYVHVVILICMWIMVRLTFFLKLSFPFQERLFCLWSLKTLWPSK